MDATALGAISGVVLSLVFSYIPGLKEWFAKLPANYKQAVMGGLLVVIAGVIVGLSCANLVIYITCNKEGILGFVNVLIAALVANQSMYLITKS